jgi:hypothetical protein
MLGRSVQKYNEQLVLRIIRDATEEQASPILLATLLLVVCINKVIFWFSRAQP